MKVTLTLTKKEETLCREVHEVVDAAYFTAAVQKYGMTWNSERSNGDQRGRIDGSRRRGGVRSAGRRLLSFKPE